ARHGAIGPRDHRGAGVHDRGGAGRAHPRGRDAHARGGARVMAAHPERGDLAREAAGLMTPRTLANSQPCLLALLLPGLDVLDVGGGSGTLTFEIARQVVPGRVVGLDLNAQLLSVARRSAPRGGLPNLRFLEGDIRHAGLADEFDLVSATRVLQWIPDAV